MNDSGGHLFLHHSFVVYPPPTHTFFTSNLSVWKFAPLSSLHHFPSVDRLTVKRQTEGRCLSGWIISKLSVCRLGFSALWQGF